MTWDEIQNRVDTLLETTTTKAMLIGFWFAVIDHGEYNFVEWMQTYWNFTPPTYTLLDHYDQDAKQWYNVFDSGFMKVYLEELKSNGMTFVRLYDN